MTNFDTLGLHPKILKALSKAGYTKPTQIQEETIPKILKGADIRASAQTGTGKTATFLLPALHRLTAPPQKMGKGPRILVLAPTRELAMQIATQAEKYSEYMEKVKCVCLVGGVPLQSQMHKLARPYDIVIATPGRLIDFIERRKIDFSRLEMLVLDEADRMLDMGFAEPVEKIIKSTPSTRQTLLFSATLQGDVLTLSERFMKDPTQIIVHSERTNHDDIEQRLHYVDNLNHKNRLLDHILHSKDVRHAIVFTATKRHAEQLVGELKEKGHRAAALHGDMNQRQRTRTLTRLREGEVKVLVATDVAARGIDVQSISHVINFDLPNNVEDYVHRIGRTGRAGAKGIALSFATERDFLVVKRIREFTGHEIATAVIAGLEPTTSEKHFFAKKRPSPTRRPAGRFSSPPKKRPFRSFSRKSSNRG